ncbi:MAG TPA: glycoside hydrolase family 15 protein [Intrasporangium sp.]|uniref:glycoside hydrolase family 15 protein n=1 Tax=Intrasporangium sp. TaxID=1925024 RepID=UPI002D770E61|nr:glycoside hydrolase family 15 protein [Intrasporangium sp.]HET7397864.1 glycoside hydrolase family 15 protein [Intrasporangium sp.]
MTVEDPVEAPPVRVDGYAPLRSYAAIGDGRSVALVAADGRIDWLAWPDLDSPSVFAALLDVDDGGCCSLAPTIAFQSTRRYLPDTNVLETTFDTEAGQARVTDLLSLGGPSLGPARELQRRVEGLHGSVPMAWSVQPRFGYGLRRVRLGWRQGVPVATAGSDAVAVCGFDVGTTRVEDGGIRGAFATSPGSSGLLALAAAHQEPLVFPTRREADERFARTVAGWRRWAAARTYAGDWRPAVIRSALALKLLVHAPSGAVAAAATTSLPEQLGGERNWDYRFCWVRDAAFVVDALLRLGCAPEAEAYFWWLLQATQLTHPRLQPLYRLDGGPRLPERSLPLAGYRGSGPVRVGNAAADQQQLDSYGELLQSAWLYSKAGGRLDAEVGRRLAEVADLVSELWRDRDAGIWEVRSAPEHFTHSKMMCWVALDRAAALADRGLVPRRRRDRWRSEAAACGRFVEERCYSAALDSYVRFAGSEELDASVLLGLLSGYGDPGSPRWRTTVEAIRSALGHGPYLYRYSGEDGLAGSEGAFLSCSFWLVEALARTGRVSEARELMDRLTALANDVGIYAEEIDPATGGFLGNLPQGLTHLALISAATAIAQEAGR